MKGASQKSSQNSNRYPFIAAHRGGPLSKEDHRKLMKWAWECSEHVLHLIDKPDERLIYALKIAKDWENGRAETGVAMKASLAAHAVARQTTDPAAKALARSIGQAVATAHMADHSLGAAFYALKAIKYAKENLEGEKSWQDGKLRDLPAEIIKIVHDMWERKELNRRI